MNRILQRAWLGRLLSTFAIASAFAALASQPPAPRKGRFTLWQLQRHYLMAEGLAVVQ